MAGHLHAPTIIFSRFELRFHFAVYLRRSTPILTPETVNSLHVIAGRSTHVAACQLCSGNSRDDPRTIRTELQGYAGRKARRRTKYILLHILACLAYQTVWSDLGSAAKLHIYSPLPLCRERSSPAAPRTAHPVSGFPTTLTHLLEDNPADLRYGTAESSTIKMCRTDLFVR